LVIGRTAVDFSMNQECAEIIKSGGSTSSHHPPISDETGDLKPVYIERQMRWVSLSNSAAVPLVRIGADA